MNKTLFEKVREVIRAEAKQLRKDEPETFTSLKLAECSVAETLIEDIGEWYMSEF